MKTILIFLLIALLLISGCGNNNYLIEAELQGINFCENKDLIYSSREYCNMINDYTIMRCKDDNNEVFEFKIECKPK